MEDMKAREPIAVASCLVTLTTHAAVVVLTLITDPLKGLSFLLELRVVVVMATGAAVASLFVGSVRRYMALHVIRVLGVLIAVRILGATRPLLELLVIAPLFVDTALYLGAPRAIVANSLQIALILGSDAYALWRLSSPRLVVHLLGIGFAGLIVSGLSILVIHYRESFVQSCRQVEKLDSSVSTLMSANKAFQHYAGHIEVRSATQERLRITRDLHDTVGYTLTSVIMSMNAAMVLQAENRSQLPDLLNNTRLLAENALGETRSILYRLRTVPDTQPKGLRAITQLVNTFMKATGIEVELNYGNVPLSLGSDLDAVVYRLIQEGLTNAFRHGKADYIRVGLWLRSRQILVTVWDNGRGISGDSNPTEEGIGLKGMRERLAEVNGTISARNLADGFELTAVIGSQDA